MDIIDHGTGNYREEENNFFLRKSFVVSLFKFYEKFVAILDLRPF